MADDWSGCDVAAEAAEKVRRKKDRKGRRKKEEAKSREVFMKSAKGE
jgi:hypothetical protein